MPGPAVTFAFILATIYGATFHLIVGGDVRRLALYLLAGWLGFAVGDFGGKLLAVELFKIGQIHTLSATVGAWTALIAARLLLMRSPRRR
jgi:hypothetical protein